MAYKTLGSWERDSQLRSKIYFVGYCDSKEKHKTFLCEEEFEKMLDYVGWELSKKSWRYIINHKFNLPKIHVQWGRE